MEHLTQSFLGLIAFSNACNWHMERSSLLFTGDISAKRKIKKIKWIDFVGFQ
jgi:hypothetical protein